MALRTHARSAIRRMLHPAGLHIEAITTRDLRDAVLRACADLLANDQRSVVPPGGHGLVFSRDRALQLDAFLASWTTCARDPFPLTVLYRATTPFHADAYRITAGRHSRCSTFVEESDFRSDLLTFLDRLQTPRISFFTDDAIFLRPFDARRAVSWNPRTHILSLAKGRDLQHCFVMDRPQRLPQPQPPPPGAEDLLCWRWSQADPGDWSTPLSVDGNVFEIEEMRALLRHIPFRSPSSLEARLQAAQPLFQDRLGLGFANEVLVNLPINTVQREIRNRTTGRYPVDQLLEKFCSGLRIAHEDYLGLSAAQAERLPPRFVPRED